MKKVVVLLIIGLIFCYNTIEADELTNKKVVSSPKDQTINLAHNKVIFALCVDRDANENIINCGIISSQPGGWATFVYGNRYGSNGACRDAGYDGGYYDYGAGGFYSSEYYSSVESKKRKVCPK